MRCRTYHRYERASGAPQAVWAVMRECVRCATGRARRYWALSVERRMRSPPGAGCGDWRSLIAMTLPYRGSLTLFPFDSEEELAKMSISGD